MGKLKSEYVKEAVDRGIVYEDEEYVEEKYTKSRLQEIIQRDKRLKGDKVDKWDLLQNFYDYIYEKDAPIVQEFVTNEAQISVDWFYDLCEQHSEFAQAKKMCIAKKEADLERKSLEGEVSATQAIFSLKQLGWTDEQQIEHNTDETLAEFIKNGLDESTEEDS